MSTVPSENFLDPPPLGCRMDQMNRPIDLDLDHDPGIPYKIQILRSKS